MKILVTGNAGFIGFHTTQRLLENGDSVVGIDNVNDYYDPAIKETRLKILEDTARRTGIEYHFVCANLADSQAVDECFKAHSFDRVIRLAAQAGVRYSLEKTGRRRVLQGDCGGAEYPEAQCGRCGCSEPGAGTASRHPGAAGRAQAVQAV